MVSPFSNIKFSNLISSSVILLFLICEFSSYLVIRVFYISFVLIILPNKKAIPSLTEFKIAFTILSFFLFIIKDSVVSILVSGLYFGT
jgi:hypothetical protein